tara:strand:- start:371 stop:1363 length:993 start_codon:yes stop_codon:yes gene_type:complete
MNDPRQAGNDEETKTFRSLIETATDDFDLNPFTETVEDAELDALLAGSNQTDGSLAGGETQGTVPPTDTAGNKGIDVVLEKVQELLGDEYSRPIRQLQGEYTRGRQEIAAERTKFDELSGKMEDQLERLDNYEFVTPDDEEAEAENQELDNLKSAITDDHRSLFRVMLAELGPEWAAENGYINTADMTAKAEQDAVVDARTSELTSALDDGIERYGDVFGSRVDGAFVLNEESKAKMAPVYARLVSNLPDGVQFPGTVLDVFEITFGGEGVTRRNSEQERIDSVLGAGGVARGSAAGGTGSQAWYKKGESLGNTIRKAAALATREVNARR